MVGLKSHRSRWCKSHGNAKRDQVVEPPQCSECDEDEAAKNAAAEDFGSDGAHCRLDTRGTLLDALSHLRLVEQCTDPVASQAKTLVSSVMSHVRSRAEHLIDKNGSITDPEDLVRPIMQAIEDVKSTHLESKHRSSQLPSIQPIRRVVGKRVWKDAAKKRHVIEDYVIDMPFRESLEREMQHNPDALRDAMEAPRRWIEAKRNIGIKPISDFCDGQAFWSHPELGKPYKEGDALRLPLMFYGDGITVANPIGVYRNNSKVFLFYWVLLSVVCFACELPL